MNKVRTQQTFGAVAFQGNGINHFVVACHFCIPTFSHIPTKPPVRHPRAGGCICMLDSSAKSTAEELFADHLTVLSTVLQNNCLQTSLAQLCFTIKTVFFKAEAK